MALTMINPASSWFEIAELPVAEQLHWQTVSNIKIAVKADNKKMLLDLMSWSRWDSSSSYCWTDEST